MLIFVLSQVVFHFVNEFQAFSGAHFVDWKAGSNLSRPIQGIPQGLIWRWMQFIVHQMFSSVSSSLYLLAKALLRE